MEQALLIGLGIVLTLSLAGVGFLLVRRVNTLAEALRTSRRALDDRLAIERERLEGLREIGEAVTQVGEREALLRLIVSTAATRLGADAATVALLDPTGQWLERVAHHNLGSALDVWTARIRLGSGSAAEAIRSWKPAIVENLEDDSRPHVRELVRAGFGSSITFPLLARGRPIGVLTLLSLRRRSFSHDEQAIGLAFAGSAAITLENARLYQQATASKEETQALAASSRELTKSLNLDHVLGLTLRQAVLLAGADLAYMALTQPDGTARFVAGLGNQARAFDWAFVRRGFGIAGLALATGEIQESADYLGDFSIWEGHAAAAAEKIRAVLVVPITLQGRTVGLLWVARRSAGQFSEQAKTRLQALAASAAIALENARLYKEIAQKNTELELANVSLADSVQVKTEFLANISHEIKTPIGSILGLLKLIIDGLCASPEEQQAFIVQAHASAQHLLGLVNDLLDMAQVESGSFRIDLESVHLGGLLEDLQAIVQVQADAKGLTLTFHPPDPAHAVIQVDLKRLMQVLLNLVGNSLKFTERGGITVRATARPERGFMTIEVTDTGIGISPERQPHLFQKFVQADGSTTRKYGGTGLGLALCKHFVEMMGGVITLESRGERSGTTVTVALPLSREGAVEQSDGTGAKPGAVQGPSESPLILIVEDSSEIRGMLRDFLNESGFQTAEAGTADEALETASRLQPALLLVDLALACSKSASLRTGVDLIAAMSVKPDMRDVSVILLTGAVTEARSLLRNLEVSISLPILEKPVDFGRLLSTVEMVLTRHGRGAGQSPASVR